MRRSVTMAPWSSLISPHSLLAPWSILLRPLLLLLVAHASRPQDIEDFKCWNSEYSPETETTIIYPYNLNKNLKGDIKSKIGSQHEVYCRFNSSIYNAQDIYLEIKNRSKDNPDKLPHKIENASTIMAMLPSDYPFVGGIRCKKEGQDRSLCARDLHIGYEPQDVENFTCISDNWETLDCTWDVPYNPLKVVYTMKYIVSGLMVTVTRVNITTWSSGQQAGILLNEDTKPRPFTIYYDHYDFSLSSQNSAGTHTQELYVNVYEIVRPAPPEVFHTTVTGPYNVTIEWQLAYPMSIFPDNVRYEISTRLSSHQSDNDHHDNNKWTVQIVKNHTADSFLHSVQLELKYANTNYEIRMRLHTGNGTIKEHMWSTPMINAIRTLSTKPTVAPKTIQGMFEVNNTFDKRDIFVFWQEINPLLKNGDGFKYIVEAYDESDKKVVDEQTESSYVKFEKLTLHNSYRFVINSSNENGTADNHSEVYVPRKAAVQKNSKTFNVRAQEAKPEGTIHTVSWSFEEEEQVQSITIFWCKKSIYEYRCKNMMEWLIINGSEMFTKEKNLTLENGTQYAFGLAVTTNNESSGIKWIGDGNDVPELKARIFCEDYWKDITDKIPLSTSEKPAGEILPNNYNQNQDVPSQPTPINEVTILL